MKQKDPVDALKAVGFTGLEAEVYTFLVGSQAASGYRVAQAIGKPAANVYKALESLAAKGAIMVDDSETRLCRALPVDELINQLDRGFQGQLARLQESMRTREVLAEDAGIYRLKTREQVFERARRMLERSSTIVILDLFPEPLEQLRPEIESACARGVRVEIKTYAPAEIEGVRLAIDPHASQTQARWPGHWINLVADGREHLVALLSTEGDEAIDAIWTESPYLSWVYHCALRGEFRAALVEQFLAGKHADPELEQIMEEGLLPPVAGIPGFAGLTKLLSKREE